MVSREDIFHGIEIEAALEPRLAAAWRRLRRDFPDTGAEVAWSTDPTVLAGIPLFAADLYLLFETGGRLRTQLNACCAERDGVRLSPRATHGEAAGG